MTRGHPRPEHTEAAAWRGFVGRFVAVFIGLLAVTLAFVVLVDPYDSGRFPSIGISGVSDTNQRTENVSLGRSGTFNAAIFGNSHGQLLDPDRLSRLTGLSFVQLTIPGANPPEQLAMMHWFVRHHASIGALVLAADERWCGEDPQPWRWFPFWLYGDSDLQYLANSLNSRSVGAAVRRIEHAMRLLHPSDPRGYDDYESRRPPGYRFEFPAPPPAVRQPVTAARLGARPFPAIDRLAAELATAPAATPLIVVFPPVYFAALPRDAQSIAVLAECKVRLARVAAATARGGFLDYLVDSPMAHDQASFQDTEHYRAPVARRIEQGIASVLRRSTAAAR